MLSDDDIVTKLRAADIVVARRTVAKYRDNLKIPSSMDRRRQKMGGTRVRGEHSWRGLKAMAREQLARTVISAAGPSSASSRWLRMRETQSVSRPGSPRPTPRRSAA